MSGRFAIVIGNTDYDDGDLAQLSGPNSDATGLADVLKDPAIGGFDEVQLLLNEDLPVISKAIARLFSKKSTDDLLLLYFSGHGMLDERGRLFLAVRQTEREILNATAISAAFVSDEMDRSRSKRQVLILDCCHSGAFERGSKSYCPLSVGTASAFEGDGYGRFVLTATDTTQYAWEGDTVIGEPVFSLFTQHLLKGLKTGDADLDKDGLVTFDELYDYLHRTISEATTKQTPSKWTYKAQGDIIIARNPRSSSFSALSLRIPGELQRAIVSTFAGVRQGAITELANLLSSFQVDVAADSKLALTYLLNDAEPFVVQAASEALGLTLPSDLPIDARGRERAVENKNIITIHLGYGVDVALIQVPSGKFLMGSRQLDKLSHVNEFPQHAVHLAEFWIGQAPITVRQFEGFTKATDYVTTAERHGGGQAWREFKWKYVPGGKWRTPFGANSQRKNTKKDPVVFISWNDAIAFCKWASSVSGILIDLPTEAQWEKAARGGDGRIWPWGNRVPDASICNFALNIKHTSPVGTFSPSGDSYYRCLDMAGNVWEWTNSIMRPYPYQDEYDGSVLAESDTRVLRGGSFRSYARRVRSTYRMEQPINACIDGYGFRVVALIDTQKLHEHGAVVSYAEGNTH